MSLRLTPFMAMVTATLLLLAGCTTQAWYEGMKQKAINDCNSLAPGERETCLAKVNRQNYERYEKEREAASKSNP